MIAYSCNLACLGCISLSDFKRDGIASFEDIKQWVDKWSLHIKPEVITIFGGEPCLHPNLIEIIKYMQSSWASSTIRLITNGYLLDRFNPEDWFKFSNFEMQISIHRHDHENIINKKIKEILKVRSNWKTKKIGGDHHKQIEWSLPNIIIYKSIFKDFVVPFKDKFLPWDSDPVEAHKICGAPATPILYKGLLYKCPPVANIIDLSGVHYKDYRGYDIDRIEEFVTSIGKPEPVCGQCPSLNQAVVINHLDIKNVTVKQKISD
jgi:organic radical activating enzyme